MQLEGRQALPVLVRGSARTKLGVGPGRLEPSVDAKASVAPKQGWVETKIVCEGGGEPSKVVVAEIVGRLETHICPKSIERPCIVETTVETPSLETKVVEGEEAAVEGAGLETQIAKGDHGARVVGLVAYVEEGTKASVEKAVGKRLEAGTEPAKAKPEKSKVGVVATSVHCAVVLTLGTRVDEARHSHSDLQLIHSVQHQTEFGPASCLQDSVLLNMVGGNASCSFKGHFSLFKIQKSRESVTKVRTINVARTVTNRECTTEVIQCLVTRSLRGGTNSKASTQPKTTKSAW